MINSINLKDEYYTFPASLGQERLWFLHQFNKKLSSAYNISTVYCIKDNFNIDIIKLQKALNFVINRHESLRTGFVHDGYSLKQIIKVHLFKTINVFDYENVNFNKKNFYNKIINKIKVPFDFSVPGLLNICIYKFPNVSYLSITIHHIISDGFSFEIFLKELCKCYEIFNKKHDPNSIYKPLDIHFSDAIETNKIWMKSNDYKNNKKYWIKKLDKSRIYVQNHLGNFVQNTNNIGYSGLLKRFKIKNKLINKIMKISNYLKVTDFSILISAYALLIYFYSYNKDFIIGTPVANRFNSKLNNSIGFFANTVLLRIKINNKISIKDFILKINKDVFEAIKYQRFPYIKIHENICKGKNNFNRDIFHFLFGLQDISNCNYFLNKYKKLFLDCKTSRADFSCFLFKEQHYINGIIEYSDKIFTKEKINILLNKYIYILENLYENLSKKIIFNVFCNTQDISFYKKVMHNFVNNNINNKKLFFIKKNIINIPDDLKFDVLDQNLNFLPVESFGYLYFSSKNKIMLNKNIFKYKMKNNLFFYNSNLKVKILINGSLEIKDNTIINNNTIKKENIFKKASSKTENILMNFWKDILNMKNDISVEKSFFELGGNSLLIAKMVNKINVKFNIVFPIRDVFLNPTIKYISKRIKDLMRN